MSLRTWWSFLRYSRARNRECKAGKHDFTDGVQAGHPDGTWGPICGWCGYAPVLGGPNAAR